MLHVLLASAPLTIEMSVAADVGGSGRWLDDCCRPIKLASTSLGWARQNFIMSATVELASSAPEALATMVEQCKPTQLGLSADGTQMISLRSGRVLWDAATRPDGLSHAYGTNGEACDSAAAALVNIGDAFFKASEPWSKLLPTVILDCIDADPTAPLAKRFRLYARHTLVPGLQRVSGLLEAHSAVVEVPPIEWCDLLFAVGLWMFGWWSLFAWRAFRWLFGGGV